ncbi:hypothetical protein chiPu_0012499 [Chiloscyllium punctatum]|uniref:Uncharacterized protein n=1 Tax=Chiloscyllium punctatum TaxID=137246 RepID=A0A401SUJ5_CHIPU|nr:hypothetical protein [Chiloscyllium punctatum]
MSVGGCSWSEKKRRYRECARGTERALGQTTDTHSGAGEERPAKSGHREVGGWSDGQRAEFVEERRTPSWWGGGKRLGDRTL